MTRMDRGPAWMADAARDRLSSTAFLAALFHGIVILGVTFGTGPSGRDIVDSSLEVVLVTAKDADRVPPEDAVLLAQKSLAGAGNVAADRELRTAVGAPLPAEVEGPVEDGAIDEANPAEFNPFRDTRKVLLATESRTRAPDEGDTAPSATKRRTAAANAVPLMDIVGQVDATTAIPDAMPRELLISAKTRESRIAAYLNSWKRKVERVGTLNFPFDARRVRGNRYPVLEVAILADGNLREVIVRHSSGQPALDQAAVKILRMAAPFEPFPEVLRGEYDVLRFAYEWHFSAGTATVRSAAGTM